MNYRTTAKCNSVYATAEAVAVAVVTVASPAPPPLLATVVTAGAVVAAGVLWKPPGLQRARVPILLWRRKPADAYKTRRSTSHIVAIAAEVVPAEEWCISP